MSIMAICGFIPEIKFVKIALINFRALFFFVFFTPALIGGDEDETGS